MEQWHYYLNLLTETIWPGGQLMSLRKLGKTEEEKEKNMAKAVETLSNSFGGKNNYLRKLLQIKIFYFE